MRVPFHQNLERCFLPSEDIILSLFLKRSDSQPCLTNMWSDFSECSLIIEGYITDC